MRHASAIDGCGPVEASVASRVLQLLRKLRGTPSARLLAACETLAREPCDVTSLSLSETPFVRRLGRAASSRRRRRVLLMVDLYAPNRDVTSLKGI